ncbi:DUF4132 domain-containing protein [Streptosporangium carneum]|uniref:DUF4132 domain-containing protein n=1 Tax=Streptosporangium carneum TaxID=47481 RepID=UPI0034D97CEA
MADRRRPGGPAGQDRRRLGTGRPPPRGNWPATAPWELAGHRPAPDTVAGLWHPIHATADEVAAWRDHLLEGGVRQPFKPRTTGGRCR